MKYPIATYLIPFCVTCVTVIAGTTRGAIGPAGRKTEAVIWTVPGTGSEVQLLEADGKEPIRVVVSNETVIEAVCIHCGMQVKFKAADVSRRCRVCPCDATNRACISDSGEKKDTWREVLTKLPRGIVLRVSTAPAVSPQSNISNLTVLAIDQHNVLVPVANLSVLSQTRLASLVKPFGAKAVQLSADGSQLSFHVDNGWTKASELALEHAIGEAGGKVTWP